MQIPLIHTPNINSRTTKRTAVNPISHGKERVSFTDTTRQKNEMNNHMNTITGFSEILITLLGKLEDSFKNDRENSLNHKTLHHSYPENGLFYFYFVFLFHSI